MDLPWEWLPLVLALSLSLTLRPWRLLRTETLWTPLCASLVILPWLWALPRLHAMPLQLQLSGSCLVLLMLGWPLAVPVLCLVAALSGLVAPTSANQLVADAFWLGVLPATLALGWGALLRRHIGTHVFVYILGRGFLGTVACTFLASLLAAWADHGLPYVGAHLSLIAHWLIAWGDGFMTGMLCAIFVAYRPGWLATWSDSLYLKAPPPNAPPPR